MRNSSVFFKLLLFSVLFYACKSQKKLTSVSQQPAVSDTIVQVPVEIKADTLVISEDSVTEATIDSLVEKKDTILETSKKDTITVIGVGDIMLGTNFPDPNYLPPNRGKDILAGVKDVLANADVTFGNHEGVILNDGGQPKYCKNPDICYLFRSPEYLTQNLVDAGFDVVSLANNHAGDFGNEGRKNTMTVLDTLGIACAGLIQRPYTSFELDGLKYGFVAFAPNTGTVSIHDLETAKNYVRHLDSLNDIVIVSFHGGAEGREHQHVTRKAETFYGENRGNVFTFSHALIDAGADVIFGHGPHVTRAIEVYKKRFIAYSLGNFATYARFNLSGPNGVAPIIKLYLNNQGEFYQGEITPIKQIGPGISVIDEEKKVIKYLQELTKADFPESEIIIDDSGLIKYIQSEN